MKVRILQTSACAACKVAAHCNASESKEKIVDVLNVANAESLKKGDAVVVSTSGDVAGSAAVLWLFRDRIRRKMAFELETI